MIALVLATLQAAPASAAVAVQVSVGGDHTCARTASGNARCWGGNSDGQLGNGTRKDRFTPVLVVGLDTPIAQIASGFLHSCALTASSGVQCWGDAELGQLGNGTKTNSDVPVNVTGLSTGVSAIAAGEDHTCALTTAGGVLCWGANAQGQLGDGTRHTRKTPVPVSGLSNGVVAISTGSLHTCALLTAGGVKCWGWNQYGQLGDGSNTRSLVPVGVLGLTGVSAISAGGGHTCALTDAGGLECWGLNSSGQLGDGNRHPTNTPVDVVGLASGVVAVDAGHNHTCAIGGGGARCWGDNAEGEVGDGTFTRRLTPVGVTGLSSGIASIDAGYHTTCAVTTSGAAKCWGAGPLGNGPGSSSATPVDVAGLDG